MRLSQRYYRLYYYIRRSQKYLCIFALKHSPKYQLYEWITFFSSYVTVSIMS